MKITDVITEAASPAQQAAIAISMKKAGKKPKTEGILGSDPNRGQKIPNWAKRGIVGKMGRKLDPAWSDVQMTVPQQLLSKQSSEPATNIPATKDMPKTASVIPTKAIPQSAGTKPSQPVTKNIVKTIADKQGVAEEASPMIKPPANRFDNKQEAFDYAKEHGGKVFKSTYIDPNTGIKNIIFVVKKEQGVAEDTELAEEFDLIESIVEMIAEHNGVDAEVVWADLETLTEDELYVFAVTSEPIMEGSKQSPEKEIERLKLRQDAEHGGASLKRQAQTQARIRELEKQIKDKQDVAEDWQKANKRDKTDGMSQKAVNAYRRENPGSKLKTAVTTKPGKLKKGGKASKRRKSYCSRSRGQMKMHSISCAKTPDKAICKARRRWNC
jgi:hypothetical protein